MFDEREAMAHVEFLAGDEFKGRLVGTE